MTTALWITARAFKHVLLNLVCLTPTVVVVFARFGPASFNS